MNIILKTQFMKNNLFSLFSFFSFLFSLFFFLPLSFFSFLFSFLSFALSFLYNCTTRVLSHLPISLYHSVSDGRRSQAGTAWRRGSRPRERRGPATEEQRCGSGRGRWAAAVGGDASDARRCARLRWEVAMATQFLLCM
jgi:hypothetical protein